MICYKCGAENATGLTFKGFTCRSLICVRISGICAIEVLSCDVNCER